MLVSLDAENSIVFMNTRPAMIFIITTFGTTETDRITLEFEGLNKIITDMIFTVTMVLWKEQPVSYLSMRQIRKVLTSSRPVHPATIPW